MSSGSFQAEARGRFFSMNLTARAIVQFDARAQGWRKASRYAFKGKLNGDTLV